MRSNTSNSRRFVGDRSPFFQPAQRSSNISPLSDSRSSQYQDRLVTIRLVCTGTNSVVCTRVNRVVPTLAKAVNGAAVCEDFMHTQSCLSGDLCPKVHVAGEYTWNYITHDVSNKTGLYEPGFTVQCYNMRMTRYYTIHSEFILPTRGSNEYVKMHNEHGDNFKAKFKLCEAMTLQGKCDLGVTCEDIHTVFEDLSSVESTCTHIAESESLTQYPRLRPDIIVRVFEQNSNEAFVDYTGDQVLFTAGGEQYTSAFDMEGRIPKKKMQHCAHFRTKRLCRMGASCRFLHVIADLNTFGNTPQAEGVSPNRMSRGDSPSSDVRLNMRGRPTVPWMSGSQVAAMMAQKYSNPVGTDQLHGDPTQGALPGAAFNNYSNSSGYQLVNAPCGAMDQQGQASPNHKGPEATHACPASQGSLSPLDGSGKLRMISPVRRHNPYALTQAEDPISSPYLRPDTQP